MKVHFIAIGGSVMHNLALSLRKKGYKVSGSDDEIFEPALSNLQNAGILPPTFGWFPEKITNELDAIVLGMHARNDNPELIRARNLGLKIFSFPAYVYEQTQHKRRLVVGGSHGKTSVTSMIMHVLQFHAKNFDFLVGSKIDGFDLMVNFENETEWAVIEGDEYLSSALEPIPKFHLYKPHVAILTGIAWDHINVFPTFENYVEQFEKFINTIEPNGALIYCEEDEHLRTLVSIARKDIRLLAYKAVDYSVKNETAFLIHNGKEYPLHFFGQHNMMNLKAAWLACSEMGITDDEFIGVITQFSGASKRLELIAQNDDTVIYRDFAHSPSKLKATVNAVKEQYPERKVVACMELHTYSSLSQQFLAQYKGSMDKADVPVVFYNHHALELKKLPPITIAEVQSGFDNEKLLVLNDKDVFEKFLLNNEWKNSVLLLMSSGNFDGLDLHKLKTNIL